MTAKIGGVTGNGLDNQGSISCRSNHYYYYYYYYYY